MTEYLADLESDLSRFHRVDDIYAMDGPRFFRLAARVFAYEGVMSVRAREQAPQPQPAAVPASVGAPERHSSLAALLASDPTLADWKRVS